MRFKLFSTEVKICTVHMRNIKKVAFTYTTPKSKVCKNISFGAFPHQFITEFSNRFKKTIHQIHYPSLVIASFREGEMKNERNTTHLEAFICLIQTSPTLARTAEAWCLLYFPIRTNNTIKCIAIVISEFLFATTKHALLFQIKSVFSFGFRTSS